MLLPLSSLYFICSIYYLTTLFPSLLCCVLAARLSLVRRIADNPPTLHKSVWKADQTMLGLEELYWYLSVLMILSGTFSFVSLLFIAAPYGRHGKDAQGWGPHINARLAWILMESPSAIVISVIWVYFSQTECTTLVANHILLGLFLLHYVHRSFIYPFRMQAATPMPISVCLMAFCFTTWNGFVQGSSIAILHPTALDAKFIAGVIIFLVGFAINIHSDTVLLNLRKPGETNVYRIPYGGMFTYVTAANYFGEIIEWTGFAIANGHLGGYAFALFTFCNIGPRGKVHHDWYLKKFGKEYEKLGRSAVIPFIY